MPIISTVAFSLFTADITVMNKALIGAEQVLGWQVGGLPEPALGNVLATLLGRALQLAAPLVDRS